MNGLNKMIECRILDTLIFQLCIEQIQREDKMMKPRSMSLNIEYKFCRIDSTARSLYIKGLVLGSREYIRYWQIIVEGLLAKRHAFVPEESMEKLDVNMSYSSTCHNSYVLLGQLS